MKAQGWANLASGLTGGVHVYLSYSNSVFYWKCNPRMIDTRPASAGGTGKLRRELRCGVDLCLRLLSLNTGSHV